MDLELPTSPSHPASAGAFAGGHPASAPPAISLPSGGGGLRGIDQKLSVNPSNGTARQSIPLPLSPGRSGFGPDLSLVYDSGAGNGPFGLGWHLSLPSVGRKTDRGLPRYLDGEDSDTFVLSDAEDLVPVLSRDAGSGDWQREVHTASDGGATYSVERFRPRIEGLFARIERWTDQHTGEAHWRSVSPDNVSSLYGQSDGSRISDPEDELRVFQWLIDEQFDDRGNAIVFEYKREDAAGIDGGLLHEVHRLSNGGGFSNRYLKRVLYGNEGPFERESWHFEVVFDYGEHDRDLPEVAEARPWSRRPDAFSSYRSGFEVRTHRLCRRVLMFHRFEELGETPCLVRSLDLHHEESPVATVLASVEQRGYVRLEDGGPYEQRSFPPLSFGYSRVEVDETVHEVDPESLENLPAGLSGASHRWVDLDGEGLSGILAEKREAWYYKRNLGDARFAPAAPVAAMPSLGGGAAGRTRLMDLAGDGSTDVVLLGETVEGFYERDAPPALGSFVPFQARARVDWDDPNLRLADLTGDGLPDLLITEGEVLVWHPSLGEKGFGAAEQVHQLDDETRAPRLLLADGTRSVYLADMCGDGLPDLVRIRNGEVCYWPNLGYGRFGAKVAMDNAPFLDRPGVFDQGLVRLTDIDGSGTADLVYLGADGVRLYFNQAGNAWSDALRLSVELDVDDVTDVAVLDLLGNGTACLVWSSPLPGHVGQAMRYVDLMGGNKPHLLTSVVTNMGLETRVEYAPSTRFYLEDERDGTPWATRLPFPVHVVDRVETRDLVAETRLVNTYRYRHGYYDPREREWRGFGCVERCDEEIVPRTASSSDLADSLDDERRLPPVCTRSWFHTGAYLEDGGLSLQFRDEYYRGDPESVLLPDTVLPAGLTAEEEREAARALKGSLLRQEVYALDGSEQSEHPYWVAESTQAVRLLQPRRDGRPAVFYPHARETLTYHYERDPSDPRVAHALTLEVDDFGNVTHNATIGYPRREPRLEEQARTVATYSEARFFNRTDVPDSYHVGVPVETRAYEVTGLDATGGLPIRIGDLVEEIANAAEIAFEASPVEEAIERRLVDLRQILYYRDDLGGSLPLGEVGALALPFESYGLSLTPGLVERVYGPVVPDPAGLFEEAGYVEREIEPGGETGLWTPSGRVVFDPDHFFLPTQSIDPFGQTMRISHDAHGLAVVRTQDPVGNVVVAELDYRMLQPFLLTDINGNRAQVAFDPLGLVVGTAVMGKATEDVGDSLEGFETNLEAERIRRYLEDPLGNAAGADSPQSVLGNATSRIVYDLHRFLEAGEPPVVAKLSRETHAADLSVGEETRVQHSFQYVDGSGREILIKVQAEPGPIPHLGNADEISPRWTGTGRTVFDNKGNPVKQYEPYFSAGHGFENEAELVESGVTPILRYDALGRLIRTDFPEGTLARIVFDPWRQETWDPNDTVLESEWLEERQDLPASDPSRRAAVLASEHAETPAVAHLDTLGRIVLTVEDNGPAGQIETHLRLDVEGNVLATTDARGRVVESNTYDVAGVVVQRASMDGGARTLLANVAGNPIRFWNARGHGFRTVYDALQRPTHRFVQVEEDAERLLERIVYGEGHPEATILNLRGQVFLILDGAGVVRNVTGDPDSGMDVAFDFKGNPLGGDRRLTVTFDQRPDWSPVDAVLASDSTSSALDLAAVETALSTLIEDETFSSRTRWDALDRPTLIVAPDASEIRTGYNEANLLEGIDVRLRGAQQATTIVESIDYNARGHRTRIDYGNGVRTTFSYDDETFRLSRRTTLRSDNATLQDLAYTYDPVGNLTEIRDAAQPDVFFAGTVVSADNHYVYDALYRLIEATGREHIGQSVGAGPAHPPGLEPHYDFNDITRRNLVHPHDGQAMRRYTRRYDHDQVGNLLAMIHQAEAGSFTRRYAYDAPSDIEPGLDNNRLTSSSLPGDPDEGPFSATYEYDAHGNMTRMPHLERIDWDVDDQMARVDLGGGGTAFYAYGAAGQRVRKVIERPGSLREERIHLGGLEIFRRRRNGALELERETLHVSWGQERMALVETLTVDTGDGLAEPIPRQRYQLGDHLGSALLEVDASGSIISREEYYPFGSTSYQATAGDVQVSLKRYRHAGKERDDETGLCHCGSRYYAPWLGRWTAADPVGLVDGVNRYAFARGDPVSLTDPTGTASVRADGTGMDAVLTELHREEATLVIAYHEADDNRRDLIWPDLVDVRERIAYEKGLVAEAEATPVPTGTDASYNEDVNVEGYVPPQPEVFRHPGVMRDVENAQIERATRMDRAFAGDKAAGFRLSLDVAAGPLGDMADAGQAIGHSQLAAFYGDYALSADLAFEGVALTVYSVVEGVSLFSSRGLALVPSSATPPWKQALARAGVRANLEEIPVMERGAFFQELKAPGGTTGKAGTAAHNAAGANPKGADFFRHGPEGVPFGPELNEMKTILTSNQKVPERVLDVLARARRQSWQYSRQMQESTGLVPIRTFTLKLMAQGKQLTL